MTVISKKCIYFFLGSETDEDGDDGSDTGDESEMEIIFVDDDAPNNDEESGTGVTSGWNYKL